MYLHNNAATARLLRAKALLQDSRVEAISPATRIAAAFDVIYLSCIECIPDFSSREQEAVHPDPDIALSAARRLDLSPDAVTVILDLMQWNLGFRSEMPCRPEEATALAGKVLARTQELLGAGDRS